MYELGDASMKGQLVHALVNTLTGAAKKKKAIKVHNIFSSFYLMRSLILFDLRYSCLMYLH